ncbi:hypothetical protein Tco_0621549 [Tanacetum coccineum]
MSNNNLQTNTLSSLHNAIMEAGGKDRPPMLAIGNYVQCKSRIKRYIDTKPNSELIHYCLENEPYKYQMITNLDTPETPSIDGAPPTRPSRLMEIYATKAIERLKQGESINVQDLEIILYWEFRKFTSRDGETLDSYYSRQTGQYENQRAVNVVGARDNVGTQVVQETRIKCLNCKEFGH